MSVSGGTAQTIATYSYDDRGNQILAHKRDFGATTWYDTTYQYDRAGYMQKSVTEKPGGITETVGHYYNGMEQRIRKVVDQNTTKYVYTGTTVLFTADDNNDKITENILSPGGQIVASNRFDGIFNGNAFFFNQDIRNSTTAIINKDLEALKYYEYDEQGREEEKGNPNFINENTFTGAISEGGNIFYMNARFYDANTGRFLSQDSYTGNAYEPWSQHLYSYCGNNPVNMIDPTGHFAVAFTLVAAAAGALISGGLQVASNFAQGNEWYEGLGGAMVGGAVTGALLSVGVGPSAAGAAGAAVGTTIDEAGSYIRGEKELTGKNALISGAKVGGSALLAGAVGAIPGTKYFNKGWIKPTKLPKVVVGSYIRKIYLTEFVGAAIYETIETATMMCIDTMVTDTSKVTANTSTASSYYYTNTTFSSTSSYSSTNGGQQKKLIFAK